MIYLSISLVILATVWSVHFVYVQAYKHGKESGIVVGRMQVLKEDMIRSQNRHNEFLDPRLISMVEAVEKTEYKPQIKSVH